MSEESDKRDAELARDLRRGRYSRQAREALETALHGMEPGLVVQHACSVILECSRAIADPVSSLGRYVPETPLYSNCVLPQVVAATKDLPTAVRQAESRVIHTNVIRSLLERELTQALEALEPELKVGASAE